MKNRGIFPAFLTTLINVGGVVLYYYQSAIFLPVVIALLLAYLLNPLVTVVEKLGIGRELAVAFVFCAVLALLTAFTTFFVLSVLEEFQDVQINLPEYATRIYSYTPQRPKVLFGIKTQEKVYLQINATLETMRWVSAVFFKESLIFLNKAFPSALSFILALLGYVLTPSISAIFSKACRI